MSAGSRFACAAASGPPAVAGRTSTSGEAHGNAGGDRGVLGDMTLPTLILFGLGTLLPCVGLWLADEADRLRP